MKVFMLPIALTLMLSSLSAQDFGSLSGKIVKDEKPVAAATVSLLRAKDSSVVKLSTSNTTGVFIFEKIPYGNYIISVTAVGHQKAFSALPASLDFPQRDHGSRSNLQ